MNRTGRAIASLWLLLIAAAWRSPPVSASEPTWEAWAARVEKQHILAGSIYEPRSGNSTRFGDAKGRLGFTAGIILLGEVHDNPDHHRVQGWIVENTAASAKNRPAVVFEHIRTDQQSALDQFTALRAQAGQPAASGGLFRLLEWDKSGWPSQEMFAPLFDAVIRAGLTIYPASPPREQVRAVGRGQPSALSDEERARLKLDQPLPQPLADALAAELHEAHCGALSEAAIGAMSLAQRYRDAAFADALLAAADHHGSAILIAGNGHVRKDRGVPWYVRQRAPKQEVHSVFLVEVEPDKTDPAAYVPRDPDGGPAADLVIFTPRAERPDPCVQLKQHFEQRPPAR